MSPFVIVFSKIPIQLKAEDSERFKTMVQFECRGLEPVDFQPLVRGQWKKVLQPFIAFQILKT